MNVSRTGKLTITFVILLGLSSCASFRSYNPVSIDQRETNIEMQLLSPGLSFFFPGDYWFHEPKRSLLPDTDPAYFKALQQKMVVRPSIFYSAHTTVQPYCSSIGLLYTSIESVEQFSKLIADQLKKELPVSNLSVKTYNASGSIYILEYFLRHPSLRIETQHNEYIMKDGNQVLRFCFWTKEREAEWLQGETLRIIDSLQRQ